MLFAGIPLQLVHTESTAGRRIRLERLPTDHEFYSHHVLFSVWAGGRRSAGQAAGTRLTIALGGAFGVHRLCTDRPAGRASLPMLYLSYGVITATGIGFAYNVVLSTVQAWFPDKKGTCPARC